MVENQQPNDAVAAMREACAKYHDGKVKKWRKEATRHVRKGGWRSDHEQDDLERAKRHEIDAAAIRALPLPAPTDDKKDAEIERLKAGMRNIQFEAERENGSWVHLKRVIAIQARVLLSNGGGQ